MRQFEIIKDTDGRFRFQFRAGDNEIVLSSEAYMTKDSCIKGIESVRHNSANRSRFDALDSPDRKMYFNLRAANGRVVGVSQMYGSMEARDKGIKMVHDEASKAKIADMTIRS
jgi:uncharacterized protein YegP (UPF0339 family)